MLDVLDQHRPTLRTVLNLAVNAAVTHVDPAYRGTPNRLVPRTVLALLAVCVVGVVTAIVASPAEGAGGQHVQRHRQPRNRVLP